MQLARPGLAAAFGTLVVLGGALPASAATDPNLVDTTSRAAVRQAYVDRWLLHAVLRATPTYLRSTSGTRTITVR